MISEPSPKARSAAGGECQRKDGTPFWNDLYVSPVRDDQGHITHFVGVQHDISQHKAYEARLAYHATHDDLTRLPNRMQFEEKLHQRFAHAQESGERISVLFVDLAVCRT